MNPTTSILGGARFSPNYFWHESAAKKSLVKTHGAAMTVPLVSASLSMLCLAITLFVEDPWFAVAGFAAAYGLFWISLPHQTVT